MAIPFVNVANNISSTSVNLIAQGDSTITVEAGTGGIFPAAPFYCSVEFEVVRVTAKAGDVLNVQRGQDGTLAVTHPVNSVVEMRGNAALWKDAYNGINTVDGSVSTLAANILNKTALPPDTTFANNTQELTHKTIDLSDSSKANVIIGTVQPDPASLPLQNLLINGGFEEWYGPISTTLAAGAPASGGRSRYFANGWTVNGMNDSSVTATLDSANSDPLNPSGTDCLLNLTTVQAADVVHLQQTFEISGSQGGAAIQVDKSSFRKLIGAPISTSVRLKLVAGNVTAKIQWVYFDGTYHNVVGPAVPLSGSSYSTIKLENQIVIPSPTITSVYLQIQFQGVGQVAVDSVMVTVGATAVAYRARPVIKPVIVENLLTNGGFEIWQRGPGPFTGSYCADRWSIWPGGGTLSVSRDASQPDISSTNCAVATAAGGVNAGNPAQLYQYPITAADSLALRGQFVTLSVRVKTNVANAVAAFMQLPGDPSATHGSYHTGSNQYETLTMSGVISAGATGVIIGLGILFEAPGTYYIDNAIMVIGGAPANYAPMHPADDLARCLRYYEKISETADGALIFGGYAPAINNTLSWYIPWRAIKPVTPTVTVTGTWTFTNCSSMALTNFYTYGGVLNLVSAGAGVASIRNLNAGTNIIIEANP